MKIICILSLFLSSHLLCSLLVSCVEKKVYVVYFGRHEENKTLHEREKTHHSYLLSVKKSKEEAKSSIIYSYKHHINGFAALLTKNEVSKLSELKSVVSILESSPREYSTQTTRSWEFLGLEGINLPMVHNLSQLNVGRDMFVKAKYGKNIVVGIIDSGIWPESKSFSDEEITDTPRSWKEGKCQAGENFDISNCNRKIIGARYYHKTFEHYYGAPSHPYNSKSPRDFSGHGTHIASVISGRTISNVEARGGFASGSISGGAPMSHLAIYKVCWQVRTQEKYRVDDCLVADVLAGIDDAISDRVDVMSISIGKHAQVSHDDELIAISTIHAIKKNIVVVASAGSNGPEIGTVSNIAPWILTVGSSSIDRIFVALLKLGDGTTLEGRAITPFDTTRMLPLVYAGNIENPNVDLPGECNEGSLNPELVRGKIVLCKCDILTSNVIASAEVWKAGGVGIIIGDNNHMGVDPPLYSHPIPAITVTTPISLKVFMYIKSTTNATASIGRAQTMIGNDQRAPTIAIFSSKGPSIFDRHVLKPDLIAPGLNILAAWSNESPPTQLIDDYRRERYNIDSGSSIAAAHVVAVVVLLKAIHPEWSVAAIKSAIMTSASTTNNMNMLIKDYDDNIATPLAYGAGHLRPTMAIDPGLVYDATYTDYLAYLGDIKPEAYGLLSTNTTFAGPRVSVPLYNLNYPTMAISYKREIVQVQRSVTNVGDGQSKYKFKVKSPEGFLVEATPSDLNFDRVGQKESFTITVTRKDTAVSSPRKRYVTGYYVWNDGSHHVRSSIVIYLE